MDRTKKDNEKAPRRALLHRDVSDGGTGVEDEDSSGPEILQPFNPAKIRVEPKPIIIDALIRRIRHGEIDMAPEFQRKAGIWKNDAQSRLIESLLIRIPLPAFYFDATNEDKWLVVDGLQRLTTLKRFVIDQTLPLSGLEFLTDLEGHKYADIPRNYQRRIDESMITVYLIEKGTPPEVKFNIFKRINTGGLPLSSQEIRHALNPGPAQDFLRVLSESEEFQSAVGQSISDTRMADREFCLRFLAFALMPPDRYTTRDDLDTFLNSTMTQLNSLSKSDHAKLHARFKRSMSAAERIFGKYAFRKQFESDSYRYPVNKALFEAWSVNLDSLSDVQLEKAVRNPKKLNSDFIKLMNDDDQFIASITQGTGDPKKVRYRFNKIRTVLDSAV